MKGPRFGDIGERTETREYGAAAGRSEMGRSTVEIHCPFCGAWVTAYLWSLAGGGKRCGCGALFGSTGRAYHWAPISEEPDTARECGNDSHHGYGTGYCPDCTKEADRG